ncbi:GTPase family protein [Aestuariimicrobium ganziense]|uniref:dynamin family protein n=1 Tax=Aestuariimicrobium ganziense TaxID=2773677 RepID=UPI001942771C|nr:dynamin family protein [Aestuariimicrobium ganziense]
MSSASLSQALLQLRESLAPVRLPLPLPGAVEQATAARDMQTQLDDYVLPRLATIDAPLLAVVGGSTGAGKSTLVNTLIGRTVTTPGVIRPTTKSPVLIHHPDDEHWFNDDRILPGLIRSKVSSDDQRSLQLVPEPSLPTGLAILDAPDIDSVVEQNRLLAAQLLQAADLWLFVTSAARYADAVPWDFLKLAVDRRAAVAVVLNRVPPAAMADVPTHLGQLMTQRGLAESPLFAVPETTTDAEGMLPDSAVSPVRTWLATLAADQVSRTEVVLQTLDGAVANLVHRAPAIADAVDEQAEALDQLREDAAKSFAEAARAVSVQSSDGTLLRGEVLTRWHDFIGTGEFMRAMEQKLSWLRDRVWSTLAGKPPEADKVKVAVESGLEALIREEGAAAAERAEQAWRSSPAGRAVLTNTTDLARPSAEFPTQVARAIREWQGDVMELVAGEGMDKRSKARLLAFGINGAAVALMVVIFAHTGGVSGAEIGIAGGTSVVAQRLLEALIGDDAVRALANQAKAALDQRVEALMASELGRFEAALAGLETDRQQAERVRDAVEATERARAEGYADRPPRAQLGTTAEVLSVHGDPGRPAIGSALPELEAGGARGFAGVALSPADEVHEAELVDHPAPRHLDQEQR